MENFGMGAAVLVVFIQGLIKEIESGPRNEGHCPLYSHCNITSIRCAHLHFINSQLRVCNKHPAYYSVPTTTHVDGIWATRKTMEIYCSRLNIFPQFYRHICTSGALISNRVHPFRAERSISGSQISNIEIIWSR